MSLVQPTSGPDMAALARATFGAMQAAEDARQFVEKMLETWVEDHEKFSVGETAACLDLWDKGLAALESGLELARGLFDEPFILSCTPPVAHADGLAHVARLKAADPHDDRMAFHTAVTWAYERHGKRKMSAAVKRQADGKKADIG